MKGSGAIPALAAKPAVPTSAPKPSPTLSTPALSDDLQRRIEEAKRKVQNAQNKLSRRDGPREVSTNASVVVTF